MTVSKLFFNRWTLLLLIIAAGAGGWYAWQKQSSAGAEKKYRTVQAKNGDVTQTVSANGTLNPVVLVNVGTQVSGTVMKLRADFNDHVKAGQILLELDPALLSAQVKQTEAGVSSARAALELANANEARAQNLFKQEYISRQDFDVSTQAKKSAQAQLEQASAQLQKDRTNFNYSVIRSPVSGVVVSRNVDLGQTVAASLQTPTLFQIAQDLRKMQIYSSFAEADIGNIKVGQPVIFSVDAFPNRSFKADVRQIRLNAVTQQNVVTYNVVVNVNNPDEVLMPGMTAYVSVVVAEKKDVLLVPSAALRFKPEDVANEPRQPRRGGPREGRGEGARATIYVLENGAPKAVQIRPGITDGRNIEVVSSDLQPGADIIVGTTETAKPSGTQPGAFRMRLF